MTDHPPETRLRVFVSAPEDVAAERALAARVFDELVREFGGRLDFELIGGAGTRPSACDLVVCVLWKGLGGLLPSAYDRPDGSPRTGIEYEFEDALAAALAHESPDILVYKKRVLVDAEQADAAAADLRALNAFWQKWFRDEHGHFTASFDGFETPAEFAEKLRRHVRQWLLRRARDVTWPVELRGSPYRSLEPFEADHAGVFFGRRRAIRQVVAKLAAAAARGCACLIVLGGSGTGKSSLVRAGLIPYLVEHGVVPEVAVWRSAVVRPAALGEDPVAGLARALFQALPELAASDYPSAERIAAVAARSAEAAAILVSGVLRGLAAPREARLILLVDQLEEVLTRPPQIQAALAGVLDALARSGRVWIVATLRSDRYPEFQACPGLLALADEGDSFDLLPPDRAEIREIIEGPARAAGLTLEETQERSLAALLEDAAQERGALPLLQFTLHRLFVERDIATGTLLLAVHDRLGGLVGAIAGEAEKCVAALPETLRAALPRLLINLVEVEDGTENASARLLRRAELVDPAVLDLADQLVEGRFLVTDGSGPAATLRLAHEALLTSWPILADLVQDQRAFLAARTRLRGEAANWIARDRQPDFLLPGGRLLAEAEEALAAHRGDLDGETVGYVEASVAAERARAEARAAAERRRLEARAEAAETRARAARRLVGRTRIAAGVVTLLLFAAASVAGLWLSQRQLAQARAVEAEKNYATALKAASDGVTVVSQARLAGHLPNDVASDLLAATRRIYDQLGKGEQTEEAMGIRVVFYDQLAQAAYLAGRFDDALDAVQQQLALATELARRHPDEAKWQWSLVRAQESLGQWSEQAGDLPTAAEQYRAMLATAEAMLARLPDDHAWRNWKSIALSHQGDTARAQGDLPRAVTLYRAALDRFTNAAARPDAINLDRYFVAVTQLALARAIVLQGSYDESIALRRQAVAAFKSLADAEKSNHNWQFLAALAEAELGDGLRLAGEIQAAYDAFQESIVVEAALTGADDTNVLYQNNLAAAGRGKADVFLDQGQTEKALKLYRVVLKSIETLSESDPKNSFWRRNLGQMHGRVGDTLMDTHDLGGAEAEYRSALEITTALASRDPSNADWRRELALAHGRLGQLLHDKGDEAGALAEARARLDLIRALAGSDPTNVTWRRDLAAAHGRLGLALAASGEVAPAQAEFAACAALPKPVPDTDQVYNRPEDMADFCKQQLGAAK